MLVVVRLKFFTELIEHCELCVTYQAKCDGTQNSRLSFSVCKCCKLQLSFHFLSLLQILKACEKVLSLDVRSPLMKVLAGLEFILKKAQNVRKAGAITFTILSDITLSI